MFHNNRTWDVSVPGSESAHLKPGCYQSWALNTVLWFPQTPGFGPYGNGEVESMAGSIGTLQVGAVDCGPRPCSNGYDDDVDGGIDSAAAGGKSPDGGCDSPSDPSERSDDLECDDGVDNDLDGVEDYGPATDSNGDGRLDTPHDAGCYAPDDPVEGADEDEDADGIKDSRDDCVHDYNPSVNPSSPQSDDDQDGKGDVCDDRECRTYASTNFDGCALGARRHPVRPGDGAPLES